MNPDAGSWAVDLMEFGCNYIGVLLTQMTAANVEEILTELLPRKVVLSSPDEAEEVVPDLLAFWKYLKREYELPNADSILKFLRKSQPGFPAIMNDTSRFGLARSLIEMGKEEGFDMTTEEGMAAFFEEFNARQDLRRGGMPSSTDRMPRGVSGAESSSKDKRSTKKTSRAKRKTARLSRKRNRRKRK